MLGVPCFPSLAALPSAVEHVILPSVTPGRVRARRSDRAWRTCRDDDVLARAPGRSRAAAHGRIARKSVQSGLLVCGANGMGFYNFNEGIWACGFQTRSHGRDGNVAYISHSGSGMCGIVDTDERIAFNLVVSTGQELAVSMDDYLDFALDLPTTRVVGLFMETARNPQGLLRALDKARARRIPVVALKVGRTELSAKLTVSHSGAIAGEDASLRRDLRPLRRPARATWMSSRPA